MAVDGQRATPSLLRSAGVGSAFAVGWTPCVGPVLAAILGLASTQSSVPEATALLTAYTAGFAIPFLLVGVFFSQARRLFRLVGPYLEALSVVSGALIIVMGILVFTSSVINLNTVFSFAQTDDVNGTVSLGLAGLLVAFAAGFISVISPCVLPMVPVYMLYITGSSLDDSGRLDAKRSPVLLHSFSFVAGFGVVFIVLGASAGLVGTFLRDELFAQLAGILLIVLGLQLAGVISIPFLQTQRRLAGA
jgi:cytochrome c biogenesis protein CcdA